MHKVELKGTIYSLIRDGDGAGDSGHMLNCISPDTGDVVATGEIRVGYCVQCGSHYARTMQYQDWWMTTPVREIISFNPAENKVEFATLNSRYTLVAR